MSHDPIHYASAHASMCLTAQICAGAVERGEYEYAVRELRGAQERAERLGREFYVRERELTAKARKAAGLDAAE